MECMRVVQLDSASLDGQLVLLFQQQFKEAISGLPPVTLSRIDSFLPEIDTAIHSALWFANFFRGASVGQDLMGITYGKEYDRDRRLAHYLLSVLLPYVGRRLPDLAQSQQRSRNALRIIARLGVALEMLSLLHHLYFLRRGGYSNLVERVLSLRNKYNSPPVMGTANTETENRELLWNLFRDSLLLAWPVAAWLHTRWQRWRRQRRQLGRRPGEGMYAAAGAGEVAAAPYECAACNADAVAPLKMEPCGCICCYACTEDRECTGCGRGIKEKKVLRGRRGIRQQRQQEQIQG